MTPATAASPAQPTAFVALEFHQLDLRYEGLRTCRRDQERRLLGSLAERGQQVPIVVVGLSEPGRFAVIDGHKRVRALQRLRCDTVQATVWEMSEVEALILERSLRRAEAETPLEQGWLLSMLHKTRGLDREALAARFDRSASWVSRRLGLVQELPVAIQERVRRGEIGAHAAMKHLLPMARANRAASEALARAIARHRLRTREVGELWAAWRAGSIALRERLLADPLLFLKTRREVESEPPAPAAPGAELLKDLDLIGGIARRARRRLAAAGADLGAEQREELARATEQALLDLGHLRHALQRREEEQKNADTRAAHRDSGAARQTGGNPPDRADAEDFAPGGAQGAAEPLGESAADRTRRAGRTVSPADPGPVPLLRGQPGPSP
jgi:ParB/RepB/Spo0J family partition protein